MVQPPGVSMEWPWSWRRLAFCVCKFVPLCTPPSSEMGPPPHHHPGQRIPPPGMSEHPPWGGNQHPDFGPPPHGFNGQSPHMRRQAPSHVNQDDPSLVPNVPYFDLPAGLMAPLVKVSQPAERCTLGSVVLYKVLK